MAGVIGLLRPKPGLNEICIAHGPARSLLKIKDRTQQRELPPAKEGLRWLALRTGPQSLKEHADGKRKSILKVET